MLGAPMVAALKSSIISNDMLSIPGSWASSDFAAPAILTVGSTHSIEILNGLAYLQKQGLIQDGDKNGHVYINSEYGDDGLLGSKAYAKDHDMTSVEANTPADEADMSAAVASLKSAGVKPPSQRADRCCSNADGGPRTRAYPAARQQSVVRPRHAANACQERAEQLMRSAPIVPFNTDAPLEAVYRSLSMPADRRWDLWRRVSDHDVSGKRRWKSSQSFPRASDHSETSGRAGNEPIVGIDGSCLEVHNPAPGGEDGRFCCERATLRGSVKTCLDLDRGAYAAIGDNRHRGRAHRRVH
ncbi:substrate-binding family protein [Antricoccus suffuscus]|uniref:Substrate-binding family protein n=1 Tax=Antricoccus suffuscus TaxID=1629062 RepID=A0A2T1A6H1_9ACTN|nr:substrate-binding family protein [Antricoccus suffuscus]